MTTNRGENTMRTDDERRRDALEAATIAATRDALRTAGLIRSTGTDLDECWTDGQVAVMIDLDDYRRGREGLALAHGWSVKHGTSLSEILAPSDVADVIATLREQTA